MKTVQIEKYIWQTPGNQITSVLSTIGVEVRQLIDRTEVILVILSEEPTNRGKSVTNGFEFFATKLFEQRFKGATRPGDLVWIEHYPPDDYRLDDEFCLVRMTWDGTKFADPKWEPIPKERYLRLVHDPKLAEVPAQN
jgi:hypothetical protein